MGDDELRRNELCSTKFVLKEAPGVLRMQVLLFCHWFHTFGGQKHSK